VCDPHADWQTRIEKGVRCLATECEAGSVEVAHLSDQEVPPSPSRGNEVESVSDHHLALQFYGVGKALCR
jgi:hypothetical protein